MAFLSVVGVSAGLLGIRIMIMLSAPLILAVVLLYLEASRTQKKLLGAETMYFRLLVAAFVELLSTGIGYMVNTVYLYRHYHVIDLQKLWSSLDLKGILDAWGWFLGLFGYPTNDVFDAKISVISLLGLTCGLLGLILGIGFVVILVRLIQRRKTIDATHKLLLYTFLSIIVVDGFVFTCMSGTGGGNGSYWLPVLPIAIALVVIELSTEEFTFKYTRCIISGAVICSLAITSIGTVHMIMRNSFRHPQGIEYVADWLVNQGLTEGYSTFWNGNVLTEVTNGKIEAWVVDDLYTMSIYAFLQNTQHATETPESKYFVLVKGEDELYAFDSTGEKADRIAYQDENGFTVFVFDE